jgi:CCR4-NOT transcription complex subunit 6
MYNHNGQQGQHVMMNGGQNHQRYGMQMPKYQHQNNHQHHNHTNQHHNQHHQGGHMGHQHNHSSGNLGSSTPNLGGYGPNHNQNGVSDSLQDEMEEPMNEHWQEQLQLAAESRQASSPHHYARTVAQAYPRAGHSTGPGTATEDQQTEDTGRIKKAPKDPKQHWDEIDFGGQGLRALSDALFHYDFLQKLHLNFNKLDRLPPSIGQLKQLTHLDVSSNQLVELPEEVGMLTNLQRLLLFDNQIQSLPFEMGFLYNLEILGIQGNPLDEDLKTKIMHEGTKELIVYLRENMPGKS